MPASPEPEEDALETRRQFLTDQLATHIDHIRTGQARRFEILRYTFAGFFAYFAFLLSVDNQAFLCLYPFETVVLIPVFLLIQVFLYIWIVNWNIEKHGGFIDYLFRNGLVPLGLGPNHYGDYLRDEHYRRRHVSRLLAQYALHSSQGVLVVLSVGCVVLFFYVEGKTGIGSLAACPQP